MEHWGQNSRPCASLEIAVDRGASRQASLPASTLEQQRPSLATDLFLVMSCYVVSCRLLSGNCSQGSEKYRALRRARRVGVWSRHSDLSSWRCPADKRVADASDGAQKTEEGKRVHRLEVPAPARLLAQSLVVCCWRRLVTCAVASHTPRRWPQPVAGSVWLRRLAPRCISSAAYRASEQQSGRLQ